MATFNSRRGPAPYIRNLNVQHAKVEEAAIITDEELRKELEIFTNTEFFDFDSGQHTDFQAPPVKPDTSTDTSVPVPGSVSGSAAIEDTSPTAATFMNDFSMDFLPNDFVYGEFDTSYPSPTVPSFPDHVGSLQPLQPMAQSAFHAGPVPAAQPSYGLSLSPGNKSEPEAAAVHPASRVADDDKRRRNTAASARFRIKKKQREQAMEKTAKDMADKVTKLESRISTLETENKWLRSLVMDKHVDRHGQRLSELLERADLSKLLTQLDVLSADKTKSETKKPTPPTSASTSESASNGYKGSKDMTACL